MPPSADEPVTTSALITEGLPFGPATPPFQWRWQINQETDYNRACRTADPEAVVGKFQPSCLGLYSCPTKSSPTSRTASPPTSQTPSSPFAHAFCNYIPAAAPSSRFRARCPLPTARALHEPPCTSLCASQCASQSSPCHSLPNACIRSTHESPIPAPPPASHAGVDDPALASVTQTSPPHARFVPHLPRRCAFSAHPSPCWYVRPAPRPHPRRAAAPTPVSLPRHRVPLPSCHCAVHPPPRGHAPACAAMTPFSRPFPAFLPASAHRCALRDHLVTPHHVPSAPSPCTRLHARCRPSIRAIVSDHLAAHLPACASPLIPPAAPARRSSAARPRSTASTPLLFSEHGAPDVPAP
ncbi:hypothetical protein B0H14DRAFT_3685023 [Mycena olivaceomarginata]|nr:hypothetical protein B0H14DRAFT_3685023 [Mycena olivaceomarginata]